MVKHKDGRYILPTKIKKVKGTVVGSVVSENLKSVRYSHRTIEYQKYI